MLDQKLKKHGRIALAPIKNNKRKIHILAVYAPTLQDSEKEPQDRYVMTYTIKLKLTTIETLATKT